MHKKAAVGLAVTATAWALVSITELFLRLPVWGFPDSPPSGRLLDALSDVQAWLSWFGIALFLWGLANFLLADNGRPQLVHMASWAKPLLFVLIASAAAWIATDLYTLEPGEHFLLGKPVGLYHRAVWIHGATYYLGFWAIAMIVASARRRPHVEAQPSPPTTSEG